MNKPLCLFSLLFVNFSVYSFNSLNLDKQIVTCTNKNSESYTLSNNSSASDLLKNCTITYKESGNYALRKETTVEFNAVVVTPVRCDYHDDILDECKFVK